MLNDADLVKLGVTAMENRKYLLHMFENTNKSDKVNNIIMQTKQKCMNIVLLVFCQNGSFSDHHLSDNDSFTDDNIYEQ